MSQNGLDLKTVDIRPGVTILSVLRHLNYKPWFAIAEFVDNSLQSFLSNSARLRKLHGEDFKLVVEVELDNSGDPRIVVRDNAAGISAKDYARAFRPAAVPLDRTGLSEFGMGLKSAACWFSPCWYVRTKALGEDVARTLHFDIAKIIGNSVEVLKVDTRPTPRNTHYTEVILENLHQPPQSKTISKIKDYLTDIYRVFIREGSLELRFDGTTLKYEEPTILEAACYKDPHGSKQVWKKEINFDLGDGMNVRGFAAIRATASTARAGFALFRRNRLIQGAGDEGYRPEFIFGRPNSFRYQRIFGELHLDGFQVSHTKDGFRWDESEQPFLELLYEYLDKGDFPLLQQADRVRVRDKTGFHAAAKAAAHSTAAAIETAVTKVLPGLVSHPDKGADAVQDLPKARLIAREVVHEVEFRGLRWTIQLELTDDPAISEWLSVADSTNSVERHVSLRLALEHPFMQRFSGATTEEIEPLLRVAAALGLAEVVARDTGVKKAGRIRQAVNELLRESLSSP